MNIERDMNFLVEKYKMNYNFQSFDSDVSGRFYGPMNTFSYYNSNGCFTIYHAVQREEWDYYYSKVFSNNQEILTAKDISKDVYESIAEVKKNITMLFKSDSLVLSLVIKKKIIESGEFFNIKI